MERLRQVYKAGWNRGKTILSLSLSLIFSVLSLSDHVVVYIYRVHDEVSRVAGGVRAKTQRVSTRYVVYQRGQRVSRRPTNTSREQIA